MMTLIDDDEVALPDASFRRLHLVDVDARDYLSAFPVPEIPRELSGLSAGTAQRIQLQLTHQLGAGGEDADAGAARQMDEMDPALPDRGVPLRAPMVGVRHDRHALEVARRGRTRRDRDHGAQVERGLDEVVQV